MLIVVGGVVLPPRPDEKPYKKFLQSAPSSSSSPIVLVLEFIVKVIAPYPEKHVGRQERIGSGLMLGSYPLQLSLARPTRTYPE